MINRNKANYSIVMHCCHRRRTWPVLESQPKTASCETCPHPSHPGTARAGVRFHGFHSMLKSIAQLSTCLARCVLDVYNCVFVHVWPKNYIHLDFHSRYVFQRNFLFDPLGCLLYAVLQPNRRCNILQFEPTFCLTKCNKLRPPLPEVPEANGQIENNGNNFRHIQTFFSSTGRGRLSNPIPTPYGGSQTLPRNKLSGLKDITHHIYNKFIEFIIPHSNSTCKQQVNFLHQECGSRCFGTTKWPLGSPSSPQFFTPSLDVLTSLANPKWCLGLDSKVHIQQKRACGFHLPQRQGRSTKKILASPSSMEHIHPLSWFCPILKPR